MGALAERVTISLAPTSGDCDLFVKMRATASVYSYDFLSVASGDSAEVLLTDIDLGRSEDVRRIWPFLRDRRIDAYGDLVKRFRD